MKTLEIKPENCKRIPLKGIGGSITAYSHKVSLIIGDKILQTEVAFPRN